MLYSHHKEGFTLTELLIVIVIIGIIASLVMINPKINDSEKTKALSLELYSLIKTTRQQAILQSAVFGLAINDRGYEFYKFYGNLNHWVALENTDKFWQFRNFPNNISVEVDLKNAETEQMDNTEINPQIVFLPSGEVTPFSIIITYNNRRFYQILGNFSGIITINSVMD